MLVPLPLLNIVLWGLLFTQLCFHNTTTLTTLNWEGGPELVEISQVSQQFCLGLQLALQASWNSICLQLHAVTQYRNELKDIIHVHVFLLV